MRDAANLRNKITKSFWYERAIELTTGYLKTVSFEKALFCIDSQVTDSVELSKYIISICEQSALNAETKQLNNVDEYLIGIENEIIASSDSEIIDNTKSKVFDLAKNTLTFHYNSNFLNLNNIIP